MKIIPKKVVKLLSVLFSCVALAGPTVLSQVTDERHKDVVVCVSIGSQGGIALSGSKDGTIKVWDIRTGKCLRTIYAHDRGVNAIALAPDGKMAASGGGDGMLKLWDVTDGREIRRFVDEDLRNREVLSISFSPDGKTILSGNSDYTVRVWDQATGKELMTLRGHQGPVKSVHFSPDGKSVVSAGPDLRGGVINIFDARTGTVRQKLFDNSISKFATYLPDGKVLLSSGDQTLKLWNASTGKVIKTFDTGDYIDCVALSGNGKIVLTAKLGGRLKVWDVHTGRQLHSLPSDSNSVFSLAVTADGERAVSGSADGGLKLWDITKGLIIQSLPDSRDRGYPIARF